VSNEYKFGGLTPEETFSYFFPLIQLQSQQYASIQEADILGDPRNRYIGSFDRSPNRSYVDVHHQRLSHRIDRRLVHIHV
jgi:hypothetical protein